MKKTNTILMLAMLLIGGIAIWLTYFKDHSNNMTGNGDWELAVPDTASVGKIFMADKAGKTITLTRNGKEWLVNGKYKARPDAVNNLLQTVATLKVATRLARAAVPAAISGLAKLGIKTEIYSTSGKLLKCYYVGGVNPSEVETFFIECSSNEPYAMTIPGFEGNLRTRYFMDEIDWRDRMVFEQSIESIDSVTIEYPLQKSKSFRFARKGNNYSVEPYYQIAQTIEKPVNRGLAEQFLSGFKMLGAEGFENGMANMIDSVKQLTPFAIVQLKARNTPPKKVTLYALMNRAADGTLILSPDTKTPVVERYYAQTNAGDWLLVQQQNFEKIFWAYESFFIAPAQ